MTAFLSPVSPSSESLNLRLVMGTPELKGRCLFNLFLPSLGTDVSVQGHTEPTTLTAIFSDCSWCLFFIFVFSDKDYFRTQRLVCEWEITLWVLFSYCTSLILQKASSGHHIISTTNQGGIQSWKLLQLRFCKHIDLLYSQPITFHLITLKVQCLS